MKNPIQQAHFLDSVKNTQPPIEALFVDDWKTPEMFNIDPNDSSVVCVRTTVEAMKYIDKCDIMYLDYDLDKDRTCGLDLIKHFRGLKIYFISINQTGGVKRMTEECLKHGILCEDISYILMNKHIIMKDDDRDE